MGPFIMNAEGVGRIFAPLAAFADGPFPEHYEPIESPVTNLFHPQHSNNPVVKKFSTPADKYGTAAEGFTIVCTTYRLTEHYHYWTKNNPMNVQLIPEPFVEMPVELAQELGIRGGDKVKVTSARSFYIAKAFVTKRIKPMMIDGKKIYQIGLPDQSGLSRDSGGRGQRRQDHCESAHAHRGRSQCAYSRIQGIPGEAGEGITSWPTEPCKSKPSPATRGRFRARIRRPITTSAS